MLWIKKKKRGLESLMAATSLNYDVVVALQNTHCYNQSQILFTFVLNWAASEANLSGGQAFIVSGNNSAQKHIYKTKVL